MRSKLTTSDQTCQKARTLTVLLQKGFSLNPVVFATALETLLLEARGDRQCRGSMMHFCLPECHYCKRKIPISRCYKFPKVNLLAWARRRSNANYY